MEKVSFEKVYGINVNEKTEQKGSLTYLSWAWAWAEFKKIYPDAEYKVDQFGGAFCSGNEKLGYMVRTEVTADGLTYEMWLPVMDSRNQTILQPKMTEVNKTIMRCLTKNLAMFGLGLYIYAGEDLPEGVEDDAANIPQKKQESAQRSEYQAKKQVIDIEKFVMPFGKHRGKTLFGIYEEAPDYIEWLADNSNNDDIRDAAKKVLESARENTSNVCGQDTLKFEEDNDSDLPF